MVFLLIRRLVLRFNPKNDHTYRENTIRIYVFWGITYGSAYTNRAGTLQPRDGVNARICTKGAVTLCSNDRHNGGEGGQEQNRC